MSFPRSSAGGVLAVIYLIVAIYVIQDDIRHSAGGWINLAGMGTVVATAPSQVVFGPVLKAFGVPKVNYSRPGVVDYVQIGFHLIATTAFIYFVGAGIQWVVRFGLSKL